MRSVADQIRREDRREIRELPAEERLELAFQLGDEALEAYARMSGLGRDEASRRMERRRQRGRRHSDCMVALIG